MEAIKKLSKGERTRQFIIETVTPVFNKKGYAGTSMSDLTKATGLTKGAIYGNFESKEELALEAFNYSFRRIIKGLNKHVLAETNGLSKLLAIVDYYRGYYKHIVDFGGCPILNIGVDTQFNNPMLFSRMKTVMGRMTDNLVRVINEGKEEGLIKKELDTDLYANLIFSQIEGGIFMSVVKQDERCLNSILDHVEKMIQTEIKN